MGMIQRLGGQLLVRNFAILAASEVVTRAMTFVTFAYLARVLGPEMNGRNSIALSITMLAMLVIDMGFPIYGAREIARRPYDDDLVQRIVSTQATLALGVVALMIGVGRALPLHPALQWLLTGYGLSLLMWPIQIMWVFQGRNCMVWMAVPQLLRYGCFFVLAIFLVRRSDHLHWLPIAEIISVVLAASVLMLVYMTGSDKPRLPVRIRFDGRLIQDVLPIGGANVLWAIRTFMPTILLGWLMTDTAAGLFDPAHRIMLAVYGMLTIYINNVFPRMSQSAKESDDALTQFLRRSMPLLIWPCIGLAIGVTLAGHTLLHLVYGGQYVQPEVYWSLTLLLWMMPVLSWRRHCHMALLALGQQVRAFWCAAAGVAALIVVIGPMILQWGGPGAAAAMLITELATTVLIWIYLKRSLPGLGLLGPLFVSPLAALAALQGRGGASVSDD